MYATHADAAREYARNVGRENPDQAWILTDYDVFMPNPFYSGPAVPHPESYDDHDDYDEINGALAETQDTKEQEAAPEFIEEFPGCLF